MKTTKSTGLVSIPHRSVSDPTNPLADKPHDGRVPWFVRLARGHRHFWDPESQHTNFDAANHGRAVVVDDESTDRSHQQLK